MIHVGDRKNRLTVWFSVTVCCSMYLSFCTQGHETEDRLSFKDPLFELLSSETTGIRFQNNLEEGLNTNILMYEYFYNGGGVAAADFNQDGFTDLYFTSNMGENRLYLNRGGWQFEDITGQSGAQGRLGPWKTGVAAIDINNDGRIDIHVSYSGTLPPEKRKNQFFINKGNNDQGIPRFEDEAESMGLASTAYTNQVYFLDYDRDGDVDILQLNHNPKNLPILNETSTAEQLKIDSPEMGLRLFRQDNGVFTDVTTSSGINGSALSYGLGIGISDLDRDGWPDFYVSNDYSVPDYLYMNKKDGTFENELSTSITHTSQFSMGNDIADINNDGWSDIFTLDMLPEDNRRQKLLMAADNQSKFELNLKSGFHYQYMRNMLHINQGTGRFVELGQYAGISNTDWSWSALLADYDNDGWRDIYITNGYKRDYTNLDFINYMEGVVARKGRLTREDVLDMIERMPSSDIANYIFAGNKDLKFKNKTIEWGMAQKANSNGAVYADLDNDGDLDIITNNINQEAFLYRNNTMNSSYIQFEFKGTSKNLSGIGIRLDVFVKDKMFTYEHYLNRGYLSTVSDKVHIGLGEASEVDSVHVHWPAGKVESHYSLKVNEVHTIVEQSGIAHYLLKSPFQPIQSTYFKRNASPFNISQAQDIPYDFDRQSALLFEYSKEAPALVQADLNGDGKTDFFVGGYANQASQVFLQESDGRFKSVANPIFEKDKAFFDQSATYLDIDKDGDLDLFVGSGGFHQMIDGDEHLTDRLYINNGRAVFEKSSKYLAHERFTSSVVIAADINGDGFEDLFIGGGVVPGSFPRAYPSRLLINNQSGSFDDASTEWLPHQAASELIQDAMWVDVNGDNKLDLITVGHWTSVKIYLNENNALVDKSSTLLNFTKTGLWNTIISHDFNQDGRPDFIIGNLGENNQFAFSNGAPLLMVAKDFDENGAIDPLIFYKIQGEYAPISTRDELLRQLPQFRSIYTNYSTYAGADMNSILSALNLDGALRMTVDTLATILLLSSTDGAYTLGTFPAEVQYASICAGAVFDYDLDGQMDLLLGGNHHYMKLRLGQIASNQGLLLKGSSNGDFKVVPQRFSGINLIGDVRHVEIFGRRVLFVISGREVVMYEAQ